MKSLADGLTMADLLGDGDGPGDPKPKRLAPQEMYQWNSFQQWLADKKLAGHKGLDARDKGMGRQLMEQYAKENPNFTLTYDRLPDIQNEFNMSNQAVMEREKRKGSKAAINWNPSAVDGWLGSKTSMQRFIPMEEEVRNNGQVVSRQNLGLLNGNLMPTGTSLPGMGQNGKRRRPNYGDVNSTELPDGSIVWNDEVPK